MTRASWQEYAARQRERYEPATRAQKRALLDEIVAVTHMHRKAVIRLLRRPPRLGQGPASRDRRRPRTARPPPCPLRGIDSDNGSEFINQTLYGYCPRERIVFTRRRARTKNDSTHMEQENGAVVRHLIGYDRFASKAAYAQLARVYDLARLPVNVFQPVEKLVSKQRTGARLRRVFDRPQTPYQRLSAAGVLPPAKRDELEALYQRLNPLQLPRQLDAALERLWTLAAPDPHRAAGDTQIATPPLKSFLRASAAPLR